MTKERSAPPPTPTRPSPPPARPVSDPADDVGPAWAATAAAAAGWCDGLGLALRDTVVLLPYAALLAPARAAFAARGGWPPRIETPATLADSLGPPPEGGLGRDGAADRLAAASLLRRAGYAQGAEDAAEPGAADAADAARTFAVAAQAVAQAAGRMSRAAAPLDAAARDVFWHRARQAAAVDDGPGAVEQALLRVAVAWAASETPADERLRRHRPAAWIVVRVGGPDDAAEAVAAQAESSGAVPVLRLSLDPPDDDPYAAVAVRDEAPCLARAPHAEAEAWATAQAVIDARAAGRTPVALVALDREQVRRVRALLERAGVAVVDETGWKLSTTRAGARLMAWLRAAAPSAGDDARLEWLKAWPPAQRSPEALRRLESRWRRVRGNRDMEEGLWQRARRALAPLTEPDDPGGRLPLTEWCERLALALRDAGEWDALDADPAGRAVIDALRLDRGAAAGAWPALAAATTLSLDGFAAWADTELEAAGVTLPAAGADVVLTPLARVPMRPFGAVVVAGADAGHLGPDASPPGLVGDALAARLGLETADDRLTRRRLALGHLLRVPALTLLRREQDGDEPLAASPEWARLQLRRRQAGLAPWPEVAAGPALTEVLPQAVARPLPVAPDALPPSLSASQVEQLRRCPYQFFARTLLRLSEPEELAREVEKRDYGNWLHAVLHRFHREGGGDLRTLHEAAEAELAATGFEPAEMLPYRASFEPFAEAYLGWWRAQQQGAGWQWIDGESARRAAPPALAPTALHGRLDRLDRADGPGDDGPMLRIVDYKTGSREKLRTRVKAENVDEDVQLAFYAALLDEGEAAGPADAALEAGYLTLDDPKAPEWIPHPDVRAGAARLVEGLGDELRRLRAGAPMPALGEGDACTWCEVRGLCRRDHWEAAE